MFYVVNMCLLSISASDELPPIEIGPLWGSSGDIIAQPHGKFGMLDYPAQEDEEEVVYWIE